MLGCKAIIDHCNNNNNNNTTRGKCSNETFVMAGMSCTPASSVEDYDDRILRSLRGLLIVARGVIEENIEDTWRRGQLTTSGCATCSRIRANPMSWL